jgi:hypothetical protein
MPIDHGAVVSLLKFAMGDNPQIDRNLDDKTVAADSYR